MDAVAGAASPSILGISFDGLAISGIVNEFVNLAVVLGRNRLRVLLDLGYDVTLGRKQDLGRAQLPAFIEPIRCIRDNLTVAYDAALIDQAFADVVAGKRIADSRAYDDVVRTLSRSLLETFVRQNVHIVVIENGTLPDNPLFTEAVLFAIAEYGALRQFGKFVFWRDHDLMWSVEPHLYGSYPYPGVRRPEANEHIHHVVTTEWMRTRMQAWAPSVTYHVIPYPFFTDNARRHPRSLRAAYGIPDSAYVIARCTRVVPQKTIERDLRLLHEIQLRLIRVGNTRKVFLFVTGPTQEDPAEFERLQLLAGHLSIAGQVIWADGLPMFDPTQPANMPGQFSISDVLAECDISSFLTSFDYEGFGLPPGEAMAMGVPFIATTYELYQEVYGSRGAVAPLLLIDRTSLPSDPFPDAFVQWTMRVLVDTAYRAEIIAHNHTVAQRFFSNDALARKLNALFG
ncbi:MAG: hypothetical protein JWM95_1610 [Gemmatimonadetes bacterium]|nr:hypothetical protein [Gemmatimonadota bacterium]